MREIYKVIGERVKQKRKARGWTQEQLADAADITTQYISRIERGVVQPSLELIYHLAGVLGCSIYELIPAAGMRQREFLSEEISFRLNHCSAAQKQFISNFVAWFLSQEDNKG